MHVNTLGLLIAGGLAFSSIAHAAPVTVTASSAVGATTSPFALGNFGNANTTGLVSTGAVSLANGSVSFTPDASAPQGGIYDGNTPGTAVSPFSGTSLTPGNYLVAEPNDPVTINYNSTQTSFNLLWGSVDQYNSLDLKFLFLGFQLADVTVTGSQVAAAIGGGFQANGSTSAFVSLSGLQGFNQVIATSTTSAFEFDPSVQVPEPASIGILGLGLAGLGFIRRRNQSGSAA